MNKTDFGIGEHRRIIHREPESERWYRIGAWIIILGASGAFWWGVIASLMEGTPR